jgi:putative ABC transport system ATP-binding protein
MGMSARCDDSSALSSRGGGGPPLLLEACGVGVRYGAITALAQADMALARGEAVGVVGSSGSGKSTLLYCLAGLVPATVGQVLLDGEVLPLGGTEDSARLRRRRFGFVFQNGLLVADLTVLENVALPLLLDGWPRRVALSRASQELAALGLAELADRFPGAVSGGQAQRAAIARALVAAPDVVFADEPTGSLDTGNSAAVLDLLLSAVRQRGAALLLVTHDLTLAARMDRVLTVTDGWVEPAAGRP